MAMVISGLHANAPVGSGVNPGNAEMDAYSKNLQNQIAEKQKELKELSSREDLSPEDKMKKRQEINKEITELNNQLRQHQMELKREKNKKESSMEELLGETKQKSAKSGKKTETGMSSASMEAIISADGIMSQVQTQSSVKTGIQGKADVLAAEIKQDAGRGASTEKKEAELADLEEKAANVEGQQMRFISDINTKLEEAQEATETDKQATAEETAEGAAHETAEGGGSESADKEVKNTEEDRKTAKASSNSEFAEINRHTGKAEDIETAESIEKAENTEKRIGDTVDNTIKKHVDVIL